MKMIRQNKVSLNNTAYFVHKVFCLQ